MKSNTSVLHLNPDIKKLNVGKLRISLQKALEQAMLLLPNEFPKNQSRLLSYYEYKQLRIRYHSDGSIRGGIIRVLFSLINFSFVRNVVAGCYSKEGGNCYDPVTMFLLEIVKLWEGYDNYVDFHNDLKDDLKGKRYREWTGIHGRIPDPTDMYNFRNRISEPIFQEIMGILVYLLGIVGIIKGNIICVDGTLLKAFGNFRGCNYMKECCMKQECPPQIFDNLQQQINDVVCELEQKDIISIIMSIQTQCPDSEALEKMKEAVEKKKKKVPPDEIGQFPILRIKITRNPADGWQKQLEYMNDILGCNIQMTKDYGVEIIAFAVSKDEDTEKLIYRCPKASADIEARTGYRRNPQTGREEAVFGYKSEIMTTVEQHLGLELPIMVQTGPGNISEAETFIKMDKKLKEYASLDVAYYIQDSGYDYKYVYAYIRQQQAIPIIDYNYRREKLTKEAMLERGYDHLGRPYAPCGCLCKEHGCDYSKKAVKYICQKDSKECNTCEHSTKKHGYTTTMSIEENPRITIEIPRSSKRFKELKAIRSSAERTNSYAKECTGFKNIRLWGSHAYAVRGLLVCITMLLKRVIEFSIKIKDYIEDYERACKKYGSPLQHWLAQTG